VISPSPLLKLECSIYSHSINNCFFFLLSERNCSSGIYSDVFGDIQVDYFRSLLLLTGNSIANISLLDTSSATPCSFKSLSVADKVNVVTDLQLFHFLGTSIAQTSYRSSGENQSVIVHSAI